MTAVRNEAARYSYSRMIIRRGPDNNNMNDLEKLFIKIDPAYNENANEVEQLMSLIEIIWKSASTNRAYNMARSEFYRPRNDISMELIMKMTEKLSKSERILDIMKDVLKQGKLLPKYPVKIENYHYDEFEITSTEGKTIFYNLYSVCRHNDVEGNEPCDICEIRSMKQRTYMMEMIKNLHCE